MKYISLGILSFYLSILSLFGQSKVSSDTIAAYQSRKLKFEEVNFVSSYYHQDGYNSAVTGGIGTENLTDFSNILEVSFSKFDRKSRINNFTLEVGLDGYSSASSDKIDPNTISSASYSDIRVYPSLSWSIQNPKSGWTFGVVGSFSSEFDYTSIGGGINIVKASANRNREIGLKLQAFFDTWTVIYPFELRATMTSEGQQPRNSFNAGLSLMQVINKNLDVMLLVEPAYQHGLLATKYQRVYFTDYSLQAENLPGKRYKLPIGLRANYFLGDKAIIRALYRYYIDDWGIKANTLDLEAPIKFTPFLSLSPFYRFYTQTAADYFASYARHEVTNSFFTSDYDLSDFSSNFFGLGIRLAPPKGVLFQRLSAFELRYGHYIRTTGLSSNILTLNLKFK
jgi:hypothetical protein